VNSRAEQVAAAFTWACLAELDAPKPGNIHVFADGHNMTTDDFVRSAEAAAFAIAMEGAGVGARILAAGQATLSAVGANTNLGIILLCAPLAAAVEGCRAYFDLREAIGEVLRNLDIADAELAFRAIVRAAPAGLGHSARHDVFAPPTVTLRLAMAEAAERDRVARQYVTDFADIFDLGLPLLEARIRRQDELRWATLAAYLCFLAAFPDSHIVRKFDAKTACAVQRNAAAFFAELKSHAHPSQLLPSLLAWDSSLKTAGLNPGTSADLTVATLFAYRLRTILPSAPKSD
jgi:triphosphoribosyl-dephospho-CoA synthase